MAGCVYLQATTLEAAHSACRVRLKVVLWHLFEHLFAMALVVLVQALAVCYLCQ